MFTVKKLLALAIWLLIFPSLANAFNLSVTWEDTVPGEEVKAVFMLDDAVTFEALDVVIGWDSGVLVPKGAFFKEGALLTDFLATANVTSPSVNITASFSNNPATGPGELFALDFMVFPPLSSPITTWIDILPGNNPLGNGLVLSAYNPLTDEDTVYTIDGYDPAQPLGFSHVLTPVPAPTPGVLAMLVFGLAGIVRQRRISNY